MFLKGLFLRVIKSLDCVVKGLIIHHVGIAVDMYFLLILNPLPNDKILDVTKLKASADEKLNFVKMTISLLARVENTVGKGENAGYKHFFPFSPVFSKAFFFRVVKSWECVVKG